MYYVHIEPVKYESMRFVEYVIVNIFFLFSHGMYDLDRYFLRAHSARESAHIPIACNQGVGSVI